MLSLILNPLILMFLMYWLARHEADLAFYKAFLICFLVSLVVFAASLVIGPFSILIYALLLPWALVQYCYLRWKTAFLVFGIFFVYQIVLSLALGLI
jgi:hypothetical protein